MTAHVTFSSNIPTPRFDIVSMHTYGYAYDEAEVELDSSPRKRKYRRFIGASVSTSRPYKVQMRQDIHYPHPAPTPVETPWKCACGVERATYYGLMHHIVDTTHEPYEKHYAL